MKDHKDIGESLKPSVVTLGEIMRYTYRVMKLKWQWRQFIGYVPRDSQFNIQVVGPKGTGKSTWVMMAGREFAHHGAILYVCAEENQYAGTIKIRARILGMSSSNIHFVDTRSLEDVQRLLDEGNYMFCIIDSINMMAGRDTDVLDLCKRYSGAKRVNFIFVNQVNSEGEAAGTRRTGHMVDIVIETEVGPDDTRWAVNAKNRYAPESDRMVIYKPRYKSKRTADKPTASWDEIEMIRMKKQAAN